MKKVLLIGNGAREHVIGETLKRSGAQVFTYGKSLNPGLRELSEDYCVGALDDFDSVRKFAKSTGVDFAFIGPENPIADGIVDMLLADQIHSVGPLQTVGRLESSKSFTRDLLKKYGIVGNPDFKVFQELTGIVEYMREFDENYVLKADGLMAGKGVKVFGEHLHSDDESLEFAKSCIEGGGRVVVEEKLIGQEFSLMSFADGTNTAEMPAVQDHKRAYEGDKGPNTGGMGTYSDVNHSLPFLKQSDIDDATTMTKQVSEALLKETGAQFKGIMYGGFIATAKGVRLIEYNARFGDPEAMNVLPILKTNFIDVCEAVIAGELDRIKVEFYHKATVCKYVVPEGYPDKPVKGKRIIVGAVPDGVKVYYASVDETSDGLVMTGSRAIAFVGIGDSISEAEILAESACCKVEGPVFHRKDIGTEVVVQKRVEMMKELSGLNM